MERRREAHVQIHRVEERVLVRWEREMSMVISEEGVPGL